MSSIKHNEICKIIIKAKTAEEIEIDLLQFCDKYLRVSASFRKEIFHIKETVNFDKKVCAYHFDMIGHSLHNDKQTLMVDTLRKIADYGDITGTDVNNIDDMKIAYFLMQAIIGNEKNLNTIPPKCLKRLSQIAYEYLRDRLLDSSRCFDFVIGEKSELSEDCVKNPNYCSVKSIVMLEKLDRIYTTEKTTINDMWTLYGKYGIYSVVKTLYLTVHKGIHPTEEDEEKTEAISTLDSFINILEELDTDLSPEAIQIVLMSLGKISKKKWEHLEDGVFKSETQIFDVLDFDAARQELIKFEGKK